MKKLTIHLLLGRAYAVACVLILFQVFFINIITYSQSDGLPRGAQLPYTRYESENGAIGGGATLQQAPDFDQTKIASEASNQKYVSLPSNGSYVEWTVSGTVQGFNMRFTMPDSQDGLGLNGALGVYVNGSKVKDVALTSYWAYQYFPGADPVQTPGGKTLMRFDEIHFKLPNAISAPAKIRIQKDNGDGLTYGVDFLELESLPAAIGQPANMLSVTSYGATADDQTDDLPAFYSCLAAATAAGKGVYIPAGRFILTDRLNLNVNNMKIQGAGIWYTEIYFSYDFQFSGGILARSSAVEISDFSMNTANNDRLSYGVSSPKHPEVSDPYKIYKGFMGTYGNGSRIHDVWVEHFECGMWIAGYDAPYPIDITNDLIITRARIRNNYADGVNFCQGTSNSVVEYSSIRNEGDDGLALWPNNAFSAPTERNNIFRFNTIENNWRAGSIAMFGGTGHQAHHNIIKDGVGGSAIRFTNDFPGYTFESSGATIYISENTITNCGTSIDLWDTKRGAIEFNTPNGIYNLEFDNNSITNSQRSAININGNNITNVTWNNTVIDGTGLDAFVDQPSADQWGGWGIEAQAGGQGMTLNNVSFNRLESGQVKNHNTAFIINITNTNLPLTGITLAPTSLSLAQGITAPLTVTYNPVNATNKTLTWTSSNGAVASVTASGTGTATVTANAVGTAVITVTSADGGFTKTCTVSVTPAVNIAATDASAGEGGNVGVFTISTSSVASNVTVNYTISGTASPSDYSPALSGSVTLTSTAPSATITITPVDDSIFEGPESLTLTLQPGTGFSLGGSTTATITIADNENPPCTSPVIGFTATAPTIDQSIDGAWSSVPAGTINKVTLGSMPGDFGGSQWRAMYDATNLYVLVEVKDNAKFNDSGASWWEDDVVEIFIDGNNSKGTSYDGQNDFQLGFRYNDANVNLGGNSVTRTTGIVFAIQNVTNGYNLEAKIPWSTIGVTPGVGNQIGFEVEVDDDDNGGTRDSQVSAFATTNMAWSNPSLFGSVYLTTCGGSPISVTGVAVSPTSASIAVGGTQQLMATVAPTNATNQNVTWASSNTAFATVSSSGLVTGVAVGNATITVTTVDQGKTATSAITVTTTNVPVTGVTVSPTTASIAVGGTQQLTATVAPSNATNKNVTWSTSNASFATVSSSGLVSGVGAGNATITVTTVDQGKTAVSTITVTSTSQSAYPNGTPWPIPGTIEIENYDLGGEGIAYHDNDAANQGGQYRTTEGVDVEVSSEGGFNVGWTGTGEWLEYTVNVATTGNYNVDVREASILANGTFHVEFNGVDKTGLFTTTNTGAWQTWTTLSKTGIALTSGIQVMRIFLDNANFNLNKITFTAVGGNVPVTGVSVSPTSATVNVGSTQQLTATVAPSNATNQSVTWSSSNAGVASVNGSGQVTGVGAGNATITVTTADQGKTATSAITVNVPAGTITCMKTAGAITVNGSLSEAQWSVVTTSFNKTTVGTPNNTATFGVLWDNNNLYIGAKIMDANLNSDSSDPWEDDAVEIYIDANNNKGTSYDGLDNQIIKNYNKSTVFTKLGITGLQHAWAAIGGGYSIEIAVPWSQLGISAPAQGTTIGFDIGYDDDDNGGARDGQAVWNGNVNDYANTSAFGSLVLNNSLAGRVASEETTISTENPRYWPTMVEHDLNIETDGSYHSVDVVDMLGRVHYSDSSIEGKTALILDLSDLATGMHLVKLRGVQKTNVFRIIRK